MSIRVDRSFSIVFFFGRHARNAPLILRMVQVCFGV